MRICIRMSYIYRLVFIGDGPVVVRSGRRGMRHLRLHLVYGIYVLYIIHTRETNVKPIENNNNADEKKI